MARGQRKVRPGEKLKNTISATTWNSMIDALGWIENFKRNDQHQERESRDGIVQVKNESYQDFSQFDVAALRDILFSPTDNLSEFKNNYAFRSAIYADDDKFKWGITQQPTPHGAIGPVCIAGPTLARVNVSDAEHLFAKPTAGEKSQLESADAGVKILWKESGTGQNKWAVILLPDGAGQSALRILPFELMQDRSINTPEERLPVIIQKPYTAYVCDDLPPSNPVAEGMISDWSTRVALNPEISAQLVWFHDTMFPHSRGPMAEDDCGLAGGDNGAIGLMAYHPEVSIEQDDEAEYEQDYCLKRFEAMVCDQRSMRFAVTSKADFAGAFDYGEYDVYTAKSDPTKAPKPLNQWPFSQAAHWWEFHAETEPSPGFETLPENCRIKNIEWYRGYILDPGAVDWNATATYWDLSRTKVYAHAVLGDWRYLGCKIEKWIDRFKAYGRPPPEPYPWETAALLYSDTYATGEFEYAMRAADGISSPVNDYTDKCVLVAKTRSTCFRFEELIGSPDTVYTAAATSQVAGVKSVANNSTNITFETYLIFQPPCGPINTDPVVIENDTTCPPPP